MSRSTRSKPEAIKDSFQTLPTEDLCERLWEILETKLNAWVINSLPSIVEEVFRLRCKEIVSKTIDEILSSEDFKESLSESIKFDLAKVENCVSNNDKALENLQAQHDKLQAKLDALEQYTRRTNLRIYGIPENSDGKENTDNLARKFCTEELDIELTEADISRSHRVGKRDTTKPRPIIVRLTRHNKKVEILKKRRQLKINKSRFSVQEDLTMSRRLILNHLYNSTGIDKVWTIDGIIFFRPSSLPSKVESCTTLEDCKIIMSKYF